MHQRGSRDRETQFGQRRRSHCPVFVRWPARNANCADNPGVAYERVPASDRHYTRQTPECCAGGAGDHLMRLVCWQA